jgi:hypothetical protein
VAAIQSGSVGSNWFGGVGDGKVPGHGVSYHLLLARDVPDVAGHCYGLLQYQKKVISENMTKICTFPILLMFIKLVLLITFFCAFF